MHSGVGSVSRFKRCTIVRTRPEHTQYPTLVCYVRLSMAKDFVQNLPFFRLKDRVWSPGRKLHTVFGGQPLPHPKVWQLITPPSNGVGFPKVSKYRVPDLVCFQLISLCNHMFIVAYKAFLFFWDNDHQISWCSFVYSNFPRLIAEIMISFRNIELFISKSASSKKSFDRFPSSLSAK